MKITVLGAGAWGTALARQLRLAGHDLTLWAHEPERLVDIRDLGRNERYLPGIDLPRDLRLEASLSVAPQTAECVVVAVPSKGFRQVTQKLSTYTGTIVSVTKGIEYDTGLTMSGILAEQASQARIAALSGPSLALEVARGIPSAIVAASQDESTARLVQSLFHGPALRVYTSNDVLGVELGGALKNVMAIAAGVCDGLGFGDNSKAALLTRGIVEMKRLGVACGAQPDTFNGLSGLGDLTVTFFSKISRNRTLGERLGRGEALNDLLASMVNVAEGYPTARAAQRLARQHGVYAPIIDEVYAMLYEGKPPAQAVLDLMTRNSKAED